MIDLEVQLEREASGFSGRVGYALANLTTGEEISRHPDDLFPTASAVKLPVLTAFHLFVEAGNVSWTDMVQVDTEYSLGGSGVLQHLTLPQISYRDAAWLMICLSDNLATNLLLHTMTLDGTNRLVRDVIGEGIEVNKYAGFQPGQPVRSMGQATPAALGRYLKGLADDRLPGAAATRAVAEQQFHRNSIPRYLPLDAFDPHAPGSIRIANKSGSMPGIRTDMALLTLADAEVTMAFMIADADDTGATFENEGERCIGRMARIAYDAWMAQ